MLCDQPVDPAQSRLAGLVVQYGRQLVCPFVPLAFLLISKAQQMAVLLRVASIPIITGTILLGTLVSSSD